MNFKIGDKLLFSGMNVKITGIRESYFGAIFIQYMNIQTGNKGECKQSFFERNAKKNE